jgi:hypothetical protein
MSEAELAEYSEGVEAAYETANEANNKAREAERAAWSEWCKWVYAADGIRVERERREKKLRKDYAPMHSFTHSREKRDGGGWDSLVTECTCGNFRMTIALNWKRTAEEGWDEARTSEIVHLKWAKAQDEAHVEELVADE